MPSPGHSVCQRLEGEGPEVEGIPKPSVLGALGQTVVLASAGPQENEMRHALGAATALIPALRQHHIFLFIQTLQLLLPPSLVHFAKIL